MKRAKTPSEALRKRLYKHIQKKSDFQHFAPFFRKPGKENPTRPDNGSDQVG